MTIRSLWRCIHRFADRQLGRRLPPLSVSAPPLDPVESLANRPVSEAIESIRSSAGASGCAVLRWDPVGATHLVLAACGTWEGCSLESSLRSADPVFGPRSLDQPAGCTQSHQQLTALRSDAPSPASLLAFPLGSRGESLGALAIAHERPMVQPIEALVQGCVLARVVAIALDRDRLAERTRHQGERIARMMSDLERLSNLLRRYGDGPPR